MSYVTITECGLLDPTLFLYMPAVRIDYNTHTLENLLVSSYSVVVKFHYFYTLNVVFVFVCLFVNVFVCMYLCVCV